MFCTGHLERGVECHDLHCRSHLFMPSNNVVGDEPVCGVCSGPADAVLQCNRCFRVTDEGFGRTRRHVDERCGAKLEYDEAEVLASDSDGDERVWAKRASKPRRFVETDDSSLELFD